MTEQPTEIQKHPVALPEERGEFPAALHPVLPTYKSEIAKFFHTAGTLELTDKQVALLQAPVEPEQILIRPEGQVYMPWHWYAQRLFRAFGAKVTFLEDEPPAMKDGLVMRSVHLIVQGCYIGHAYGEQIYHPTNPLMTYGDAIEGALSNAKARCCKAFNMARELWDANFRDDWISKNTTTYMNKRNKRCWKKKGVKTEGETVVEANTSKTEKLKEDIETAKKTKNEAYLKAMQDEKARVGETAYYKVLGNHGYSKSNEITDLTAQRLVYKEMVKLPGVEDLRRVAACDGCGETFPVDELSVRRIDSKMFCRAKCWSAIVEKGIKAKKNE